MMRSSIGEAIKMNVNELSDRQKVYYSHAMPLYGTTKEIYEKSQIRKNIPTVKIVDPGTYQDNPEKRRDGMEYCLKLVKDCDSLVFSKYQGKITAGVGKEVNFAIENKIPVYELNGDKLHEVESQVEHLSVLDTLRLYHWSQKI